MPLVKTDGVIILNQNFETNCKMQLEINKSAADKVLKSITGNYLLKDKIVLKVLE
jgi:hypothetical protein